MMISRRSMLTMMAVVVCAPVVLFALAVAMPAAQAPLPHPADTRLLTNVRIIDVDRGRISEPTDVLIERGRIKNIATGLAAGRDIPVLDAKGRYLSPGFWDMHTHAFQRSPQLHFPLYVANGVTGMRDMMDCPRLQDSLIACVDDKRRWHALAAAGRMTAPRFVEVASFYFDDPQMTPAQASQRAATYHHRGVDTLKVYNRLPHDTYLSLAADARKLQMQLVGHLPKSIRLEEALQQGQRSFEHGHLLARHCFKDGAQWRAGALDAIDPVVLAERMVNDHDPAACLHAFDAMRAAGVWWVPTHVTREEDARAGDPAFLADPRLKHLDPLSRWAYADDLAATVARYPHARGEAALGRYFEHGLALTGAAHRAGVHILIGTDTAIGGFRFHDEMALLVRAGMSPAAVLRAATLDAAHYAGMQQHHGSVAVGKMADLVLLDANPLDDISNTRRIHAVLLGGRLHDRQGLDALLRFNADQANSPTVWAKLLWGFARSPVSAEL